MAVPESISSLRKSIARIEKAHENLSSKTSKELTDHLRHVQYVRDLFPSALLVADGEKDKTGVDHGIEGLKDQQKTVKEYEEATKRRIRESEKRPRDDGGGDDHREKRQK